MAALPGPSKTPRLTTYDSISATLPALSPEDKNVIITGNGTGIGQGNLTFLDPRLKPLEDTKGLIKTPYPNHWVHVYTADIADEATLSQAFRPLLSCRQCQPYPYRQCRRTSESRQRLRHRHRVVLEKSPS